jgi:hypothetical protein
MNNHNRIENGSRFMSLRITVVVTGMMLMSLLGLGRLAAFAAPLEFHGNQSTTYLQFQEVLSGSDVEAGSRA